MGLEGGVSLALRAAIEIMHAGRNHERLPLAGIWCLLSLLNVGGNPVAVSLSVFHVAHRVYAGEAA
jgi:hypothetical protein